MKNQKVSIEVTSDQFRINSGVQTFTHNWNEIKKITAYKRDLITVDLICLLIEVSDNQYELNEEVFGWNVFIKELEYHFPSIDKQWNGSIMKPAFEINETVLYDRTKNNVG